MPCTCCPSVRTCFLRPQSDLCPCLQSGSDAVSELLLAFHAHQAAAAAASIDAETRGAAGATVVAPHRYSDAVHMLDEAAALAHTTLSSAAPASAVESHVRTLQQARETLDAVYSTETYSALARASLPRIDEAAER